jgi:hypothetical protein
MIIHIDIVILKNNIHNDTIYSTAKKNPQLLQYQHYMKVQTNIDHKKSPAPPVSALHEGAGRY